ncbi:MAG: MerR family transcriptional regulator [Pseudomonadota bacterium]
MSKSTSFLSPSEAAAALGVSTKALRIYERRGLLTPARTEAGWRAYGPAHMKQARKIAAFRALGLTLHQIADLLDGDTASFEATFARHQADLEAELRTLTTTLTAVRRARLDGAAPPTRSAEQDHKGADARPVAAFPLPWPWGGERFELRRAARITYITGPLFSGKTQLARRLAETIPGARFVGLERMDDPAPTVDPTDVPRAEAAMRRLTEEAGATESKALEQLLAALFDGDASALIIDMVEEGLDEPTQRALISDLQRRAPSAAPLFLLTRSDAILDLGALGPDEAILYCPANHSPPVDVAPTPGAPGYEATAACLASPAVRARSAGVIAVRTAAA